MAHKEQTTFFISIKDKFTEYFNNSFVLDVGSLDINGNNQYLFESCTYIGVDIAQGDNVDIISKGHELNLPDESFDVVISSECFEHDMYYVKTLQNMLRMLKPGGLFTFTCATTGRPEHGTARTTPNDAPLLQEDTIWSNYYLNLTEDHIRQAICLDDAFTEYGFSINDTTHDLYFYGVKKGVWIKRKSRLKSNNEINTELKLSDLSRRLDSMSEQMIDKTALNLTISEMSQNTEFKLSDLSHRLDLISAQMIDKSVLNLTINEMTKNIGVMLKKELEKSKIEIRTDKINNEIKKISEELDAKNENLRLKNTILIADVEHLTRSLDATHKTMSWKITKPIRFTKRVVKSKKPHQEVLKPIYHHFPTVLKFRLTLDKWRKGNIANKLFKLTNSPNNLLATKALTENRFAESLKPKGFKAAEMPQIDLTVVTFNSSKWVESFFNSLLAQNFPTKNINLLITDNSSTDSTVTLLKALSEKHADQFNRIAITQQDNLGFGAGHHSSIQNGQAEFCLISNIDLEFEDDAISTVVSTALTDSSDVASWELRQVPFEHPKYYDPVTLETNWSSHACILIRRSAYDKVKGYEPRIFMYCEDVEFSYRLRANQYRIKYCPSAVVRHYTYEEASQIKPLQYSGSILGNSYLRLRYGSWSDKFAILPLYAQILSGTEAFEGAKQLIKSNLKKTFKNTFYFLKKPSKNGTYFPFRGFVYDFIREGAFYQISPLKSGPLVSIITRTYKGRDLLLSQAIQSVINQTYSNIELIIVEDGGNTLESLALKQEMPKGKTIHYYPQQKVGRSVTGNFGLSKASGEFLMFLDDDDLLFADHVEVLVDSLLKNKDIVASYALSMEIGTHVQLNNERHVENYTEEYFHTPAPYSQEYDYDTLLHHNFITIQSILFCRSCFDERGGFDIELDQLEDWNLWLRYGYKNSFKFVPKTTSLYRIPSKSDVKLDRHQLLNDAYDIAKLKAHNACLNYTPIIRNHVRQYE